MNITTVQMRPSEIMQGAYSHHDLLKSWTEMTGFLGSHTDVLLTTLLSWFIKIVIKQNLNFPDGF